MRCKLQNCCPGAGREVERCLGGAELQLCGSAHEMPFSHERWGLFSSQQIIIPSLPRPAKLRDY